MKTKVLWFILIALLIYQGISYYYDTYPEVTVTATPKYFILPSGLSEEEVNERALENFAPAWLDNNSSTNFSITIIQQPQKPEEPKSD